MTAWDDHRLRLVAKEVRGDRGVLVFEAPGLAEALLPGQFLHLEAPGHLLRRPMAPAVLGGRVVVFLRVRGEGTRALLGAPEGAVLRALGPLGNAFPEPEGRAVLVSGGTGIGPLLFLARTLVKGGREVLHLHGARDAGEALYLPYLRASGAELRFFTEGGALGERGLPTDALPFVLRPGDTLYAVGPEPMMAAAARVARTLALPAFVSLEAPMACGVGACLSCAVQTKKRQKHVCVDGPIFPAEDVFFAEAPQFG